MFQLYKAIWQATARLQITLIVLAIAIAALAAAPLEFQKRIINGLESQSISVTHLVELCLGMIGVVCASLTLKWILGMVSSTLGEDVILRIRNALLANSLDKGQPHGGTLATTIAAEAEEVGKFTGNAFSEPVVQVGTLISVIGYIAATQPRLGMIAIAMIIPQIIIVLITQRKVNALVARRVQLLRGATDKVVDDHLREAVSEVHQAFDSIYEARRSMFMWKLSTKFLLSLLNGVGTVAVLLLGGMYVLRGDGDVGTVVAATIGLGRLQAPTSFMIAFYRTVSATRVKFELLREFGLQRASAQSNPVSDP